MGDGMKRATLEAVCARGPWSGGVNYYSGAWTLTTGELRTLYDAIPSGEVAILSVLACKMRQHRKVDRALQLLRVAGLIEFVTPSRTWRQT